MLTEYLDLLHTIITKIMTQSIRYGELSQSLQKARVIPCLKKSELDPDKIQDLVSNLSFLSKH